MILILSILEIRYGLNNDNVSTNLLEAIYESCINFHEKLAVEDLKNCFNFAKIEKKQYQKITLDEFLEPIKSYIQVKQVARQILIEIEQQEQKEQIEKQKEIDFYNQARELYKLSVSQTYPEWLGDMFQAKVLARPFWDALYMDERKQIQILATEKVKEAQTLAIDNPLIIVADKNFYLAQEVISHCVKQGKTFIQE
jgi:hypothetical protein